MQAGMEKAATFLETRRYSAYVGGTTEANKWEGISYDPDNGVVYTSITDVSRGMEDNKEKGKDTTKRDIGGRHSTWRACMWDNMRAARCRRA